MDYKEFFRGKKVTQMGLGLLGRGVGDAQFLAECGADLIVTDMKSADELAPSLEKLRGFPNITFKLGGHNLEDFANRDFILKAAGVPFDSTYIGEAKKNNIPIEMDASLFCKLLPKGVFTIGVTGTRGKSTVTHLIYHLLSLGNRVPKLGGNVRDMATLPLLKEVNPPAGGGDTVVLELDSWQLQGFGEAKLSPHIAVFTNLMEDHKNYYKDHSEQYFKDKANIFKFQNANDFLIVGESVAERIKSENPKAKLIVASKNIVPKDWDIKILGEHNLENIACAIEAVRALGISEENIKKGVESFGGVEGRLQFVREINLPDMHGKSLQAGGVKIYNDNNATTPEASVAALKAIGKNIVLICGGADKGLDLSKLIEEIKSCKSVILLPGSGSDKLNVDSIKANNLKEAVDKALENVTSGDTILFSPAFASFGPPPGGFKNEYDRNDQFMEIIKNL